MASNAVVAVADGAASIMEEVIAKGDLSRLSPEQRATYYVEVCRSVGLNPLTKPFEYMTLNNKLVLYALKNATDQLRTLHRIDITETRTEYVDELLVVTVFGRDRTGRQDSEIGAVAIGGLKGEAKANALMKGLTKAKRRLTLSMCGLGMLDESEAADIQPVPIRPVAAADAERRPTEIREATAAAAPDVTPEPAVEVDRWTGEVRETPPPGAAITKRTMSQLHGLGAVLGLSHDDLHGMARDQFGVASMTALTEEDAKALHRTLTWADNVRKARTRTRLDEIVELVINAGLGNNNWLNERINARFAALGEAGG